MTGDALEENNPLFIPIDPPEPDTPDWHNDKDMLAKWAKSANRFIDSETKKKLRLLFERYNLDPDFEDWEHLAKSMAREFLSGFLEKSVYEAHQLAKKNPANAPKKWHESFLLFLWCRVMLMGESGTSAKDACADLSQKAPWKKRLKGINPTAEFPNKKDAEANALYKCFLRAKKIKMLEIVIENLTPNTPLKNQKVFLDLLDFSVTISRKIHSKEQRSLNQTAEKQ